VRSRKFIHIGRMKINTIKPLAELPLPRRIMARGYARTRQRTVLIRDSPRDSHKAFQ
jgi:hypothetical protein